MTSAWRQRRLAALTRAHDRHGAALYHFLLAYTCSANDAADCLTATFTDVARAVPGRDRMVRRALWRAAVARARRVDRDRLPMSRPAPVEEHFAGESDDLQRARGLPAALAALLPEERLALLLEAYSGLARRERADCLDMPAGVMAQHARTAWVRLGDSLAVEPPTEVMALFTRLRPKDPPAGLRAVALAEARETLERRTRARAHREPREPRQARPLLDRLLFWSWGLAVVALIVAVLAVLHGERENRRLSAQVAPAAFAVLPPEGFAVWLADLRGEPRHVEDADGEP